MEKVEYWKIEYWKIEVAVFLPLPHPKNKTCFDSTEVELYALTWPTAACHSPDAICLWLGGLLGKLLLGGLILGELLMGGLLLSELLLPALPLGELLLGGPLRLGTLND